MKVGFTGTRHGMGPSQVASVKDALVGRMAIIDEAHHGSCEGSDEEFHDLCTRLRIRVIVHPPVDMKAYAECTGAYRYMPPKSYRDRNQDIVDESDVLIATPLFHEEHARSKRSGTWQAVRMARKRGIEVLVFERG